MSTNLSLSFELICLMGWLLRHHKAEITQIIENAIEKGFLDELQTADIKEFLENSASSNEVVHEFFGFFERLIQQRLDGEQADMISKEVFAEELTKIDSQLVDQHVLFSSIQKVKNDCAKEIRDKNMELPESEVKALLCEQLLKQWQPSQHDQLN